MIITRLEYGIYQMILPPFELKSEEKSALFLDQMNALTIRHYNSCELYRKFLTSHGYQPGMADTLYEIPWIPARAFKSFDLKSTPDNAIVKTIQSSGTGGKQSTIYVDSRTSVRQGRALQEILKSYLDHKLPLLIIDSSSIGKNLDRFGARTAGALGFSQFASSVAWALDEHGLPDWKIIKDFLDRYPGTDFMIFGFTYLVWQILCRMEWPDDLGGKLSNARVFHGGGWKKLASHGITNEQLKSRLLEKFGIRLIHDYYGMAEQTGSIFVECGEGKMHASKYSEIIIRDLKTLEPCVHGETGVIQVFSSLPESYPGHAILTEDIGWIESDATCACGRNGTAIHVEGRLPLAELRGCSDAY